MYLKTSTSTLSFITDQLEEANHPGDNKGMLASDGTMALTDNQKKVKKKAFDDTMAEDTSESTNLNIKVPKKEALDSVKDNSSDDITDLDLTDISGGVIGTAALGAGIGLWNSNKYKAGF